MQSVNSVLFKRLFLLAFISSLVVAVLAAPAAAQTNLPDFTSLVKQDGPAVVRIEATRSVENIQGMLPNDGNHQFRGEFDDFIRRYFGMPDDGQGGGQGPGQSPRMLPDQTASGSGFIISGDGYIVTNNHVVDGADSVVIHMPDRREFQAEIVGTDAATDVALLKIDTDQTLPSVRFGDSDELQIGEWVIAIGSPFSFEHSVTSGIVSAKSRSFGQQQYVPFIQTDVPINRGNSGGPLINMQGEVVGVNSQIFSASGGYMGLSFAIPSRVVQDVVAQLKESGTVARGWLGVGIQYVDQKLARSFGLKNARGAAVGRVEPGTPAARAKLRQGDVILEVDGERVPTSNALPPIIGGIRPGNQVDLTVWRDGKTITVPVTIGALPGTDAVATNDMDNRTPSSNVLGLEVEELEPAEAEELNLDGGVYVTRVESREAYQEGIRQGDTIQMINSQPIESLRDFNRALEKLESGDLVRLLVGRGDVTTFVVLEIADDS